MLSIDSVNEWALRAKNSLAGKLSHLSAEGVQWLGIMFMHCATIPSLLGIIFAVSDNLPSLDIVFFIWTGLLLFFINSLIRKDILNIITICLGFIVQAFLLGMIVFK